MKNKFKLAAGLLHAILLLALIIPLIYNIFMRQEDIVRRKLYGISLLIAFPVIVTGIAIRRCRSLWSYLAVCTAALAVTGVWAYFFGTAVLEGNLKWGYMIILMSESLFVVMKRFLERIRIEQERREDNQESKGHNLREQKWKGELEKPRVGFLAYFLVVYLVGLGCFNPPLCNEALGSAILYLFITVPYYFLDGVEEYLLLQKRVSNLPSKRVYGISKGVLSILLVCIAVFALLSALTGSYRTYTDIRELGIRSEIAYIPPEEWEEPDKNIGNQDLFAEFEAQAGPAKPVSMWFQTVMNVIGIVLIAALLAAAIRGVRTAFGMFRESYDENGDIVESLEDEVGDITQSGFTFLEKAAESEQERIRRYYRKVIRKHRKDRPAPYETPLEIETAAHIADSEEGRALHRKYEKARYGK